MANIKKVTKAIKKKGKALENQPGLEAEMQPQPEVFDSASLSGNKLQDKIAIITGGDSGIGHAVALLFAKEGADIVVSYLSEHVDAEKVKDEIESMGRRCLLISGDIKKEKVCQKIVNKTLDHFGKIDILVNNAGEHHPQADFENISTQDMIKTFETNVFSYFYLTQAALPYLKPGSVIINTSSVVGYRGSQHLIDYSATKGAINTFTRSLALSLVSRGIRVNGVAPGPIWTPLVASSFSKEELRKFGKGTPMARPGQPEEVAPCYLFLASEDSSYVTGQFLHPNGGEIVAG